MLEVHIKQQLQHFALHVQFKVGNNITMLTGPSGSGKTTILNAISGLMPIQEGIIKLGHRLLVSQGKSLVPVQKRKIGYVFQDYALFPHRTVWENIAYGLKPNLESEINHLMEELGIAHLQKQYPHEISGGEKQRTALIRALASAPELLLLDEPFSALDDETRRKSQAQLLRIQRQWEIPMLLVTHQRTGMETLGEEILYLEQGKIDSNE